MLPTRTTDGGEERGDFPCFELKFDFLKRFSEKPLTLTSTGNRRISGKRSIGKEKMAEGWGRDPNKGRNCLIVPYTKEKLGAFKENMASENTKKSTSTTVRRLESWFVAKYKTGLDLNSISKTEAPELLKHFFVEIRKTKKKTTKAKNMSLDNLKLRERVFAVISFCARVHLHPTTSTSKKMKNSMKLPKCYPLRGKIWRGKASVINQTLLSHLKKMKLRKYLVQWSSWPSKSSLCSPSCLVE